MKSRFEKEKLRGITMSKYICTCGASKEITKSTIKIIDGKVRVAESKCKCGKYMEEEDQTFTGFPSLIRTDPTLNKK
jgi:hypothetical protein